MVFSKPCSHCSPSIIKMPFHFLGYSPCLGFLPLKESPEYVGNYSVMKARSNLISWPFRVWHQPPRAPFRSGGGRVASSPSVTALWIWPPVWLWTSLGDMERHFLPYYWPRRSDGPSTSHSLCSLPLHAELKTSICSSKIVQTAATRGKYHKNRILKTKSHMLNSLLFLPGHSTSNKQI